MDFSYPKLTVIWPSCILELKSAHFGMAAPADAAAAVAPAKFFAVASSFAIRTITLLVDIHGVTSISSDATAASISAFPIEVRDARRNTSAVDLVRNACSGAFLTYSLHRNAQVDTVRPFFSYFDVMCSVCSRSSAVCRAFQANHASRAS